MTNDAMAAFLPADALRRALLAAALPTLLAACGGGSSAPAAPRAAAVLSVSSPVASQGASGQSLLAFRAAMLASASYPVQIAFTMTNGTGGSSCSSGVDYTIIAASGLTINSSASGQLNLDSASASRQVNLLVCPGASATDKVLSLAWKDGSASAGGSAGGTIRGSANASLVSSKRLNDTGITGCASASANALSCPQAGLPGQDAEAGRDANAAITGQGGNRVSAFALTQLPGASCVQDNVTGLLWEGKTGSGLHAAASTYAWFNSGAGNGGAAGTAGAGVCSGSGCDTEQFVAAVNVEAHCGFTDWRLPTADELAGIVDSGAAAAPTVSALFANQAAAAYWTASPKSGDPAGAWMVDFNSGAIGALAKSSANRVRLVRGH